MSETEENFSPEISQSEDIILNKDNLEINDEIKEQTNNDSNKEEENNVQVSPDSSSNEINEETTIIDVLYDENQDNSKNSVVEVQKSNKTTKEFSCDSCGKHFLRVSSVQQHLKNEHKDNPTTTYSEVQTNEIFESGEFDVNSSNNQFHENFRENDFTKNNPTMSSVPTTLTAMPAMGKKHALKSITSCLFWDIKTFRIKYYYSSCVIS